MIVYFVGLFCRTVLLTKQPEISISSDTIQNMFSAKFKERNTGDIL